MPRNLQSSKSEQSAAMTFTLNWIHSPAIAQWRPEIVSSGRTRLAQPGVRCSIVANIVLAHQSDPFRGGDAPAISITPVVKADAKNHDRNCNDDGRIHRIGHGGLLPRKVVST